MVPISALWMPILLSAVIVFVASSILHMVLPYHKSDYRKLPEEDRVVDALRAAGVTPGPAYHFPHTTHKEMKSPEVVEKFKRGPIGLLTVIPSGPPAMGKYLGMWFVYCVVVGIFVAIVAGTTLSAGTRYVVVFHLTGLAALLAYGVGQLQDSIWKGQVWSVTAKHVFDGLIYALLTAGTFGWLWPR
jgi:hypothetical protein